MKNRKPLTVLALAALLWMVAAGCGGNVVAEVNNEKITRDRFEKRMEKEKLVYQSHGASFDSPEGKKMLEAIEEQTLEKMIEQVLILQSAKKEGVYPTPEEMAEKLEAVKSYYNSEDEFNQALKEFGYTVKELEEQLAFEAAYQNLFEKVTAGIKIENEQELRDWYENNKESYKDGERQLSFEEVRDRIADELTMFYKQQEFQKYMSEVYANSKISKK